MAKDLFARARMETKPMRTSVRLPDEDIAERDKQDDRDIFQGPAVSCKTRRTKVN